jgi:hypothetical protein
MNTIIFNFYELHQYKTQKNVGHEQRILLFTTFDIDGS